MILISNSLRELEGQLVGIRTYAIDDDFSPWYRDADEAYENFRLSLTHLRTKLGDDKYLKLLDMLEWALGHFEGGDKKRGGRLMQDMGQVIRGKPPFAYPKSEWRWGEPLPIAPNDLTEDDLGLR